ncbi:hypothetical protein DICPUDRAFT_54845, partial [Dictyostelium purpureum]
MSRLLYINNLNVSLKFIHDEGIKTVGLGSEDIVDKNLKLIMGLIWTLILTYQIQILGSKNPQNGSCKFQLSENYPHIQVNDLTKSFQDGLLFCALVHKLVPDKIDFASLNSSNPLYNLQLAFETANRELNIPSILDPQDISTQPDEKSILTYISFFPKVYQERLGDSVSSFFSPSKRNSIQSEKEQAQKDIDSKQSELDSLNDLVKSAQDEIERLKETLKSTDNDTQKYQSKYEELERLNQTIQDENKRILEDIAQLTKQQSATNSEFEEKQNKLFSEIKEKDELIERINSQLQSGLELQTKYDSILVELNDSKEQKSNSEKEFEKVIENLKSTIQQLQEENKSLASNQTVSEDQFKEKDQLLKEKDQLLNEKDSKINEITQL